MATFLQLCARAATRGSLGVAPAAVTGQVGRQAKICDWVVLAWETIQNMYSEWSFLHGEVSAVALTISDMSYTATDLGISTRFGGWKGDRAHPTLGLYQPWTIYDNSIGVDDETALYEVTYEQWRFSYDRGSHDASRPIVYAMAPDQSIRFGPKPDLAYRVRGEYSKAPQTLAANGDIPDMPSQFHDIIAWKAILLAAEHDEAVPSLQLVEREYLRLLNDLQRACLPPVTAFATSPIA
jgi:hypothetical protein